jgi:hypothetical protein
MIDFKELPRDGDRFEQLIRELLMLDGMQPRWTGKGPDDGRDLLVTEDAQGALARFSRKWLVQCKHFAHGGRSVGRDDVGNFARDCRQAGARGYLLACSTVPSAGLVRLLEETGREEGIQVLIWDNVYVERRLLRADAFRTAHQFFPRSMSDAAWQLFRVETAVPGGIRPPWAAHYKDDLVYLACRMSASYPSLSDAAEIIEKIRRVDVLGEEEQLRARAVYFDEKHSQYSAYVDYMIPGVPYTEPERTPACTPEQLAVVLREGVDIPVYVPIGSDDNDSDITRTDAAPDGEQPEAGAGDPDSGYWYMDWRQVDWYVRVFAYSRHSDHYDPVHHDYYPDRALRQFALGGQWGAHLESHVAAGDWLRVDVENRSRDDELLAYLLADRRSRALGAVQSAGE